MTPDKRAERSNQLLGEFDGYDTGDVITILATALQMAICYGANTKDDAMDMLSCIMVDAENDMPKQYDLVQDMRSKNTGNQQ